MGRLHYVFISLGDADTLRISCKKHFKELPMFERQHHTDIEHLKALDNWIYSTRT